MIDNTNGNVDDGRNHGFVKIGIDVCYRHNESEKLEAKLIEYLADRYGGSVYKIEEILSEINEEVLEYEQYHTHPIRWISKRYANFTPDTVIKLRLSDNESKDGIKNKDMKFEGVNLEGTMRELDNYLLNSEAPIGSFNVNLVGYMQ